MKKNRSLKIALVFGMLMLFVMGMSAMASSDNSLAALNVQNGTVTPEFVYSTWEYQVKVAPGTTELLLDPVLSDSRATITSITGNPLDNGNGTIQINTKAENGAAHTYTLHVSVDESLAPQTEAPTEVQTEAQTEKQTEAPTEKQTEAVIQTPVTEITENEAYIKLNNQVNSYKERLDLSMKIIYGLIGFSVLLLFIIINMILKNKDLKDDLRDAQEAALRGGYPGEGNMFGAAVNQPMTKKEKKAAKKAEKEYEKELKKNNKKKGKKGKKAEMEMDYQEQNMQEMNFQQQPVYQQQPAYQQQPVYQQQPAYQQQPVYQQQPAYQQQSQPQAQASLQPENNTYVDNAEAAFMPEEQVSDGKNDVDVTMVEL